MSSSLVRNKIPRYCVQEVITLRTKLGEYCDICDFDSLDCSLGMILNYISKQDASHRSICPRSQEISVNGLLKLGWQKRARISNLAISQWLNQETILPSAQCINDQSIQSTAAFLGD
ncbi:unnamed protein product [Euphydryas editha]|uniref:Uncharacterized protein n=1 Tax=Euphydryas editha TaxID=104508 RepID=A0AAU9TQ86_EUPED|nr:unnamed protein product [Euphydryas editha]